MKNDYCDLTEDEIKDLNYEYSGFLLSPFQFNLKGEFILVPEVAFKEMINEITKYAQTLKDKT